MQTKFHQNLRKILESLQETVRGNCGHVLGMKLYLQVNTS